MIMNNLFLFGKRIAVMGGPCAEGVSASESVIISGVRKAAVRKATAYLAL